MLRTFILNADGSVSLSREESVVQSQLAKVLERLQRRDYTAAELMPLISNEITRVKSNITAEKSSSESQELKRYLLDLYLVRDYVMATSAAVDRGEHELDWTDLKIVESDVFRRLGKRVGSDDASLDVATAQTSATETFGEVSAKFMIEVVSDGMQFSSFKLLLWDGKEAFIQDHVALKLKPGSDSGAVILKPPNVDPTIRQAVRFPRRFVPFHSTPQLFEDICALVRRFTHLSPELASLVGYAVLASWFPDCTPAPVCVSIIGPRCCQRSNLFRLLSCLFRRALVLGEIGAAAIGSIPTELSPALFLERCELDQQLPKIARASNTQRSYVPSRGQLRNVCCAKVICNEERLDSITLGQGAVEIRVTPTHRKLPLLETRAQEEIAEEFQPRLLGFRLAKCDQVRNPDFDVDCWMSSVRDLGRTLGACVADVPELRKEISPLLSELDQELQLESECTIELRGAILEALKRICQDKSRLSAYVGEIADRANAILGERGEIEVLSPKRVGAILKSMGIYTRRLDASGRGILLMRPVRARIYSLAQDCATFLAESLEAGCTECCPPRPDSGDLDVLEGLV